MNKIILGDSLEVLKRATPNSVDSIVTDPPYELGFMGKSWDNTGIANNPELWKEYLRVLKPGGHLLAFSGTRTYHRMASAIEDAGFEVRDMIEWVYGSGFPKSLNIGKAVDKLQRNEREVVGKSERHGGGIVGNGTSYELPPTTPDITKGTSEWEGWGTALKPAHEPICMARKPLSEKTVAENVLKYGTGGINIDGSRVETSDKYSYPNGAGGNSFSVGEEPDGKRTEPVESNSLGRFPANLIHDNSEEVRECFPEQKSGAVKLFVNNGANQPINLGGGMLKPTEGSSGNASRFFKSIKVGCKECGDSLTDGFDLCGNCLALKHIKEYRNKSIIYQAKSSKSERNKGLDNTLTVKYNGSICKNKKEENMVAVQLLQKVISGQELVSFSTEGSGENIMVQCQSDSLSTILTETKRIIELKIYNSLMLSLTNESTQVANSEMEAGGNLAESVADLKRWLLTTTEGNQELALGASRVVLETLQLISEKENWKNLGNFHSTVKPIALMEYLIKMVTPKGGVVLDPFAGSGSTLVAAKQNGFQYIGIEMTEEYIPIIEARLNAIKS
jgi:site-specific DNA-methyltransferase (adenine-specific)